jgi:gamma-glutamyltranspeptidase / glutathione hydrolase
MFLLYYDAQKKKVFGLNGSGRAPASLTIANLRKQGITGTNIPMSNVNSVTVPGAADGWITTIKHFGSGILSTSEILEPAIKLAEEGFPVSELTAQAWGESEQEIKTASPNGGEMLRNGRAPKTGEIFRNPTLAETFRTLGRAGPKGFYEGRIAEAIVDVIQSLGGEITLEDLRGHKTEVVEPITVRYAGLDVWECPPNGQGIVALMALGIIQELQEMGKIPPLSKLGHNSAEYLHIIIESLRMAFADAVYHVTDPDHYSQPEHLLSKAYLQSRAKLFNLHKQVPRIYKGEPVASSDTVYFSVTDQWGNAASFINSNFRGFGTAIIPRGCGFTLQNRGSGFVLREGHPNCLKGGKRPYHTIIPAMVLCEGFSADLRLPKMENFGLAMESWEPGCNLRVPLPYPSTSNIVGANWQDTSKYCSTCSHSDALHKQLSTPHELQFHRTTLRTRMPSSISSPESLLKLFKG